MAKAIPKGIFVPLPCFLKNDGDDIGMSLVMRVDQYGSNGLVDMAAFGMHVACEQPSQSHIDCV